MEKNIIEKYELIDGTAVIDNNFNLITANESMFRFIGTNTAYTFIDVIHQVDMDDFIDVINSLRINQSKNIVLRMRRSDNSFRWMLVTITKSEIDYDHNAQFSYYELKISDIIAVKHQNIALQNSLISFRHLLAMENELFYTYDYNTCIIRINYFIDNEITTLIECSLEDFKMRIFNDKVIDDPYILDFKSLCNDIAGGTVSYHYQLSGRFITANFELNNVEIKGSTIYTEMKPAKAIGSIKNLSSNNNTFTVKTYEFNNNDIKTPYDEVKQFCINNIQFNPKCELTLILFEIDNFQQYEEKYGRKHADELYATTTNTIRCMIGYRGTVCEIHRNLLSIAVKEINLETNLRAFIESLRTQISWDYHKQNPTSNVTFSIGISRYPQNGTDLDRINRKLVRALEIAENKGHNRFIIYKEHLHGELN